MNWLTMAGMHSTKLIRELLKNFAMKITFPYWESSELEQETLVCVVQNIECWNPGRIWWQSRFLKHFKYLHQCIAVIWIAGCRIHRYVPLVRFKKIQMLSEASATTPMVAKLCSINCKNRKITKKKIIQPTFAKYAIFTCSKVALRVTNRKFWDHFYKSNNPQKWWNCLLF